MQDPSAENRMATATKLGRMFASGEISAEQRTLAADIFRVMVGDMETRVRHALAESLKLSAEVPHDVAQALANDVVEVASPILECSEVLTDADLVEIIAASQDGQAIAISRRSRVSEPVSDALIETHDESVVASLMENEGAEISVGGFDKVLTEWRDSDKVKGPMVRRRELPVSVAEKLVNLVSDRLRDELVTRHELPDDVAIDLILEAREKATLGLMGGDNRANDARALVAQLHRNGRLTPSIVTRAICLGDRDFFEAAISALADIKIANAHILISDPGDLGLKSLCRRAGIPAYLFAIVEAAVTVAAETDYDGGPNDRARYRNKMIERVLTKADEGVDSENAAYLISKLVPEAA